MANFYNIEWVSPPSESADQHGNRWHTIIIQDRKIKTLAKNPPQVGQVYGEITEETSQAGKPYHRFRRKQVPDGVTPPSPGVNPPSAASVGAESSELLRLVREIHAEVVGPQTEVVPEEVPDEPIDLDGVPF